MSDLIATRWSRPAPAPADTRLTTPEVCDLLGIYGQKLDRWLRAGVLGPFHQHSPGSGRARTFSVDEALVLYAVATVDRCPVQAVGLDALVRVARAVRDHLADAEGLTDEGW